MNLNPNLLSEGDTLIVPATQGSIPETGGQGDQSGQTGQDDQTTGQGDTGAGVQIPVTGEGILIDPSASVCGEAAPGTGHYVLRGGESLSSVAEKFGVEIEKVLELNPATRFSGGQVIVLPGVEAPGLWNNELVEDVCDSSPTGNQTGSPTGE